MMRALVTGGTGFIGANLVAGLAERGITPRVLMRSSSSRRALEGLAYETAIGDILDAPRQLAETMEGCAWLFHVAAVSDYWRQGKERLYRVNVKGTRNVLQAAEIARVERVVFTSSLTSMGIPSEGQLLDESCTFEVDPETFPYGHSKHLAEQEVQQAVAKGLPAVIVNPCLVLGPRDVNLISGAIIVEAARGSVWFYPPGGTNFVDVADVVAGHIAAAEKGRSGERYILGGTNLPYSQAIPLICDVVGRPPPLVRAPKWLLPPAAVAVRLARRFFGNRVPLDEKQVRMMGRKMYANVDKALQELGLPQTPFQTTVQRTYNWYNENGYLDGAP